VTVHGRAFSGTGAVRTLEQVAEGGSTSVHLSDRTGLAGNPVLRFGQAEDPLVAYRVVDTVASEPADLTLPGQVTLRSPLVHTYAAGTLVEPVTPDAITTTANLARAAQAGDGLLILDAALTEATVEIADLVSLGEIHALGATASTTGFYRLDGIGRLAKVRLQATAAGHQANTLDWIVNYGQPQNAIDFLLAT
jgi:hypothetical protein